MRVLVISAAALALSGGTAGMAQDRARNNVAAGGAPMVAPPHAPRWGGRVDGHWWAGVHAPGGWRAYSRPRRGMTLPAYWIAPGWSVEDWAGYDLPPPPPGGYRWSRYYDDAVLIDAQGRVYDTIGGVDWDRHDDPRSDYAWRGDRAAPGTSYGYPDDQRDGRANGGGRGSPLAGAAVGAAVGGVAGNLIAGRGNRLGGTLIGAGVGAGIGALAASDRGRHQGRDDRRWNDRAWNDRAWNDRGWNDRSDAEYPPPPAPMLPPPTMVTSADGSTVVTTSAGPAAPGYYANGYYYPGATVTTITIQSAPATRTVYEERVRYVRAPARKRKWRPAPTCACR